MEIKKADKLNLDLIVEISKRSFQSDLNLNESITEMPPGYDSISWHKEMLDNGNLYQVEVDNKLIGAAILFENKEEHSLFIGRIFIDVVYFRKQYGIMIMKKIEEMFRNLKTINLDTPIWNFRTNNFYKKLGYTEVHRDEDFVYFQKKVNQ